jgi:hypothetical protein
MQTPASPTQTTRTDSAATIVKPRTSSTRSRSELVDSTQVPVMTSRTSSIPVEVITPRTSSKRDSMQILKLQPLSPPMTSSTLMTEDDPLATPKLTTAPQPPLTPKIAVSFGALPERTLPTKPKEEKKARPMSQRYSMTPAMMQISTALEAFQHARELLKRERHEIHRQFEALRMRPGAVEPEYLQQLLDRARIIDHRLKVLDERIFGLVERKKAREHMNRRSKAPQALVEDDITSFSDSELLKRRKKRLLKEWQTADTLSPSSTFSSTTTRDRAATDASLSETVKRLVVKGLPMKKSRENLAPVRSDSKPQPPMPPPQPPQSMRTMYPRQQSMPVDDSPDRVDSIPGYLPYRPPSTIPQEVALTGLDPKVLQQYQRQRPTQFARAKAVVTRFDAHAAAAAAAVTGVSSPVFRDKLDKMGRNGRWQNREFRFDGAYLVCLRPGKIRVTSQTIRMLGAGVYNAAAGFYDTKPPLPRIGHPLLATPDETGRWVRHYQAPKWVISIDDITSVDLYESNKTSDVNMFVIRTDERDHIMRAGNKRHLASWLFLLRRMVDAAQDFYEEMEADGARASTSAGVMQVPISPSHAHHPHQQPPSRGLMPSDGKHDAWRRSVVELVGFDSHAGRRMHVGAGTMGNRAVLEEDEEE